MGTGCSLLLFPISHLVVVCLPSRLLPRVCLSAPFGLHLCTLSGSVSSAFSPPTPFLGAPLCLPPAQSVRQPAVLLGLCPGLCLGSLSRSLLSPAPPCRGPLTPSRKSKHLIFFFLLLIDLMFICW